MKFREAGLRGAYLIELEPITDERGFFARSWSRQEFTDRALNPDLVQCNVSFNHSKGTIRGLHYQREPFAEAKLVRCTMGAIFDVIVDLRTGSPTRGRWFSVELTAQNRTMLYVPEGMAHGFQSLVDETEIFYQMTAPYTPDAAGGIRWNDKTLAISWPIADAILSERDRNFPDSAWDELKR